jgi:hypothetical protein
MNRNKQLAVPSEIRAWMRFIVACKHETWRLATRHECAVDAGKAGSVEVLVERIEHPLGDFRWSLRVFAQPSEAEARPGFIGRHARWAGDTAHAMLRLTFSMLMMNDPPMHYAGGSARTQVIEERDVVGGVCQPSVQ